MGLARKNVLVTGGTGFIGSHLVEQLLKANANVIVPYQSLDPRSYFKTQQLNKKAILAVCDLADFKRVFELVCEHEVDYIFHLGAVAIVGVAYDNPIRAFETNVLGTVNVLEAARLYSKVGGIVVTSSDKAYGKIERASEKDPIGGDHPYESSKAAADLVATTYFATYKLPVVVTRFGNVYGEGDLNFSRIIPGMMKAVIGNETLNVRSNGKYVRDYVYVGDVVDAMIILARNISKVGGEAFNISSLENLSVLALLRKVSQILSQKIAFKITNTAVNEIPVQSVNFAKIRKTLGWKPKKILDDAIPEIYDWYKSYFENL